MNMFGAAPPALARDTPDADVRSRPEPHLPGEVGIWVFIFGDMLLFAVFFTTYLYDRAKEPGLFKESQRALNPDFGAVNTVLLLVSSLLVAMAVRAVRGKLGGFAPRLIAGAFACGLGFSGLKAAEYSEKVGHNLTPCTNNFFMYYFVLTGLHWFHLIVGLGVLTYLFALARNPRLTPRQLAFFEGGACYWHVVDLLWIVLFPLLYLVK
jgi:nitric oxide reductase NorE protein